MAYNISHAGRPPVPLESQGMKSVHGVNTSRHVGLCHGKLWAHSATIIGNTIGSGGSCTDGAVGSSDSNFSNSSF